MTLSTTLVQGFLASAAALALGLALRHLSMEGKMQKVFGAGLLLPVAIFGSAAAFGSPSGEALLSIDDGSYIVMSAIRTDETQDGGAEAFYNMLLIVDGEARFYRVSHDVLEVDNTSKESESRTLTVVSKQGLRKATLYYPLIGG